MGFVHFDRPGLKNHQTEMLVPQERVSQLVRNRYVIITNPNTGGDGVPKKQFLGRLVEGPFFAPEELSRDSALSQTSILWAERFPIVPKFYAVGGIEILGELDGTRVIGASTRPAPQAVVEDVEPERLRELLGIKGDVLLGRMDGYQDLPLFLDSHSKSVLPRNVGIFGTVGSGKTNSAQVLIEEASAAGYAVVVIDVEGEYVAMDKPTEILTDVLAAYGKEPEGLSDSHVYHACSTETAREDGKAKEFTIQTARLDPLVLSELIEAAEAQERRLLEVIEAQKRERKAASEGEANTLKGVIGGRQAYQAVYTLDDIIRTIDNWAFVGKPDKDGKPGKPATGADLASYLALKGKLGKLKRTGAFDVKGVDPIQAQDLLQPGRVSVFDVSYTSDRLKNIVIAELLRTLFEYKLETPSAPKTLVFIEEAHTFVSAERVGKMQETIEMLREIARRGRKRWLSLVFISQQPSHLPAEIFELCNTRIVHNVKSTANLQTMKATGGDVSEEIWNLVPSLGVGQAVISTPQYRDPLVVNMRPCKTRRQFVA